MLLNVEKKIEKMDEKNLVKKKKCPRKKNNKKGHYPKRGTNCPIIGVFCFSGGDILKSCAQSKFKAQRLKIALFRTARTF